MRSKRAARSSFSALQRAENSSMSTGRKPRCAASSVSVLFSEPKIPQSITGSGAFRVSNVFQCSSASRKFLNSDLIFLSPIGIACFSALQRAENSSIRPDRCRRVLRAAFQCSSASRKFLNVAVEVRRLAGARVSVLFSEPKIPQYYYDPVLAARWACFSALQRAENSSISHKSPRES